MISTRAALFVAILAAVMAAVITYLAKQMITDTETQNRRAMCRDVQPRPTQRQIGVTGAPTLAGVNSTHGEPDSLRDPMATVVRELALRENRSVISVASRMVVLRMFSSVDEAERVARKYYPHDV